MDYYYVIVFLFFGFIFGSFYNVVGLRVPKGNFLASDRSYCPTCNRTLKWTELIPIVSFLLQKGECKGCKSKISYLYPLVELITGLLFMFSYLRFGISLELLFALLINSLCVIIFVTDFTYYLIPNKILWFFLPLLVIGRLFIPLSPWYLSPIGAIIGFALIFLVILLSKGGMGAGDMKYFFVLGYALGAWQILLVFLLSTLYGSAVNLTLLLFGKVTRKTKVPFGPYISAAAITSLFYGDKIINWYIGFF